MTAKLSCMVLTAVTAVLFIASLRYITDFWLLAFVTSFQLHIAVACILLSYLVFWLTRDAVSAVLVVWSLALAIHAVMMLMEFSTSAVATPGAKPFRLQSWRQSAVPEQEEDAPQAHPCLAPGGIFKPLVRGGLAWPG